MHGTARRDVAALGLAAVASLGGCNGGGSGTPDRNDGSTGADTAAAGDADNSGDAMTGDDSGGASGSDTTEPMPPPPPSDNVIDVAIWPRIVAEGAYPLVPADDRTLCRRMALDLWGMVPTPAEFTALCEGQAPGSIAWSMMEDPRFVARETRLWIRAVGVDAPDIYSHHIPDADAIYERLSTGEIDYAEFAGELLAHPVMAVARPEADGDDPSFTIRQAFRFFLGRPAQGDEFTQLRNLMRVWARGWESRPGPGPSYKRPAYLDGSLCQDPVYDDALCTATLFGQETIVDLSGVFYPNVPPQGFENSVDGMFYFEMVHGGSMPPEFQAELIKPGLLLASQDAFWDEASERALSRILGWWRSTADEPDSTVPEVGIALGAWWKDHPTHDIRELYAVILSSVLYTTDAAVDDTIESRSIWSVGPTRLMDGEQYLDSLQVAFDRELGFCDPHTAEPTGAGAYDDVLREPQPADFYGFGYDAYYDWGTQLGGCVGGDLVPRQPGLRSVFAHTDLADQLCAPPSRLSADGFDLGDTSDPNRHAAIEFLYATMLARLPDDSEWQLIDAASQTCLEDLACGADGLSGLLREVCGAIIRSGEFVFY